MRNLHVTSDRKEGLAVPVELGDVVKFAVDSDGGMLFIAGSGLGVAAYRTADCMLLWYLDLRERLDAAGSALPPPSATIAAFDHVPELGALCLALSSGELLLLSTEGSAGRVEDATQAAAPAVEEVGAVEGGFAAAAWSPDGELLVLVTGSGSLLLMNKAWELLSEVSLLQHKGQPLSATGTAAAVVARHSSSSVVGSGPSGEHQGGGEREPGGQQQQHTPPLLAPGSVSITWRGDGRFFATASLDMPDATSAVLRVWDRETGELHAQGEAAAGLLPAVAWQPNGRHLFAGVSKAAHHAPPAATQQQQRRRRQAEADDSEQARQAVAEGIQHVGAWKRELRRRQAQRTSDGGMSSNGAASIGVMLFERNGLQHGGFEVAVAAQGDPSMIEQLAWSPDSEFLALVLAEGGKDGLPLQVLQLWHRSNWHWYLKGERRSPCCSALHCCWDAAAPLLLHLVSAEGTYQQLQFSHQPTVSGKGTAAVVDGTSLLLTPLRHSVVPPPMCAAAAILPAPISCLAIQDYGEQEAVAVVLSDGVLALLTAVEEDLWEETLEEQLEAQPCDRPRLPRLLPQLLTLASPTLEVAAATGSGSVQAAAWVAADRLLLAVCVSSSSSELLVELAVDAAAGTAAEVAAVSSGVPPLLACCSCPGPAGGVLLQQHSGTLLLYSPGGVLQQLPPAACFPSGCHQMAALAVAAADSAGAAAGAAVIGLSARGQLYWGGCLLAANVTSFALRTSGPGGAYLLYTTRQHTLHTLPVASLAAGSGGLPDQRQHAGAPQQQQWWQGFRVAMRAGMRPTGATAAGVTVRNIEQNALLIAVPPGGVQAILQMPRGNLEAVCPRALVLPAIAAALDAGDYAGAWDLAAINRLDLNVLVDYAWPRFLGRAPTFVEQVSNDQDLADLLSALSEASTAASGGLYAAALPSAPVPGAGVALGVAEEGAGEWQGTEPPAAAAEDRQGCAATTVGGKVQAVCAAVRNALEQKDKARYLRAILTSHAKCGELEAALTLVKQAKEEQMQGRGGEDIGAPTAEDGLRHLLLFILDDTLYQAALGMYELELAYMVVAHSQKDPGEYLLELQAFATEPNPLLRRHHIDAHLRRWDRALSNLVAAGEEHFPAALELARDKGLLRLLLKLQEGDPQRQRQVHAAYGAALEGKNLQEDAGLAYIAAGQLGDAIRAYRAAGQWRMCFALAAKARWDAEQQRKLAAAMADELSTAGKAADAAEVTLQYLQNVDSAVMTLAHGKEWREALQVAYCNSRPDLVDTVVAPQAARAAVAALGEIGDNIERVEKYLARLQQLRQRRSDMEAALAAAEVESGLPSLRQPLDAFDDTESVADSMVSGLSIYTDHTHTGATTVASTSLAASTVGGKRRPRRNKGKSHSSRIRQGSPQEEEQLTEHLLSLAPSAASCAEVGQLAELLVLLGHQPDAALLQHRLAVLVQRQAAAAADILAHPPPVLALALPRPQQQEFAAAAGPGAAAALVASLAVLPGVALLQRVAAAEAAVQEAHWKWDILRDAPQLPPNAAMGGKGGDHG